MVLQPWKSVHNPEEMCPNPAVHTQLFLRTRLSVTHVWRDLCAHPRHHHTANPQWVLTAPFARSDQCWKHSGTQARLCSAGCSEQSLLSSEGQSWQLGSVDNQQTLEKDRRREWETSPKLRLCGYVVFCLLGFFVVVWLFVLFGVGCSGFFNKQLPAMPWLELPKSPFYCLCLGRATLISAAHL